MEFIVGTVLAGVPIVLEAYDRYWDISECFSTFRHYSQELIKLDTIIKTQKTLFRWNIIKLLTEVTNNPEKARNLLSDSSKEKWEELKLLAVYGSNRLESLQETFASWKATLELVLSSVTAICLEVESFRTSNAVLVGSMPSREILKQLPKRFRLCWKKNEVQESIKELRDFTSDFKELTTRVINELMEIRSTSRPAQITVRRNAGQLNSLEMYSQIRSASYMLYNTFALRWSCARHQRHAASISLVDDGTSIKSQVTKDGIKFDVAINCDDLPTCQEAPIWLVVETVDASRRVAPVYKAEQSEIECDDAWAGVMEKITKHSQPMVIEHDEKVHKKLVKKAVRFQSAGVGLVGAVSGTTMAVMQATADNDKDEEAIPTSTTATSITPNSMIDLEMVEDFCRHFRVPRPTRSYTCIGYIKDLGLHRFYLPPPERRLSGQQKSLAEIITWISEDEFSRSLSRTAMAHLASSLAATILQYHSTPWLPETWQSSHVRFFGIEALSEDANGIAFTTPYFSVEFSKPDEGEGRLTSTLATNQPSTAASTATAAVSTDGAPSPAPIPTALARNELLFRFGIVLLELGYCQPWLRLRQRMSKSLPPQSCTDYHAAEKLAQMPFLRDRMGPRFPIIVRKCLGCDFGLGENDLANKELQGTFLVDVVGALQEVERGLRELKRRLGAGGF